MLVESRRIKRKEVRCDLRHLYGFKPGYTGTHNNKKRESFYVNKIYPWLYKVNKKSIESFKANIRFRFFLIK